MDVEEFKLWSHLAGICGYFSFSFPLQNFSSNPNLDKTY